MGGSHYKCWPTEECGTCAYYLAPLKVYRERWPASTGWNVHYRPFLEDVICYPSAHSKPLKMFGHTFKSTTFVHSCLVFMWSDTQGKIDWTNASIGPENVLLLLAHYSSSSMGSTPAVAGWAYRGDHHE